MKKRILKVIDKKQGISAWNATAYNMRFGATAAVAPRKRQCRCESLYPAGSLVEAATTPSRWDVSRHLGDSAGDESK